jgi:hypothetical protein
MALPLILEEFEQLKGQFVITASQTIERLVTIGEDDMDYYYVTFDGRSFKWNTCVGRLIPLKGHLRNEDYNELVRIATLNHYDFIAPTEFIISFNKWKKTLKKKEKFHTEFYFNLEKNYKK